MSLRGEQHRRAIGSVLDAFGAHADHFVFAGSTVLGLYARPQGTPLRATKDVDCISTQTPWILQEKVLGELCANGVLVPDREVQCRYRIRASGTELDVLSPEGLNVGGVNPWFGRACARAQKYAIGDGRSVRAISPPYFLATKLVAFEARGPDAQSSKDAEDIVTLALEVETLAVRVDGEGLLSEIASLWRAALAKYALVPDDLRDLVEWHMDRDERPHLDRVVGALSALANHQS